MWVVFGGLKAGNQLGQWSVTLISVKRPFFPLISSLLAHLKPPLQHVTVGKSIMASHATIVPDDDVKDGGKIQVRQTTTKR